VLENGQSEQTGKTQKPNLFNRPDSSQTEAPVDSLRGEDRSNAQAVDKTPFPDPASGAPEEIWPAYFSKHRPPHQTVSRLVLRLHNKKLFDHAAWVIQAALLHGQSQPWMYEALAGTMELQGRPAAEIERVVMSIADFGPVEYKTMMFSAAYLAGLNRDEGALKLYQQASRLIPERPEPYVMSLRLVRKTKDVDATAWAVTGVMQYAWTRDYQALHREAENAYLELQQHLAKTKQTKAAQALQQQMETARERDLIVRLTWSGEGDLDLFVEEPSGSICSFEAPDSIGGGVLTRDGFGPQPANCFEEYVCALGQTGEYRIRVRTAWGDITGNRATLTIIQHAGTKNETSTSSVIQLTQGEAVVRVNLEDGRRKTPRMVATARSRLVPDLELPVKRGKVDVAQMMQIEEEFQKDRRMQQRIRIGRTAAFGYAPVLTIIPDGVTLGAVANISADRRYVRLSLNPQFNNVTSVSTFSIIGGLNQAGGGGGQQNGNPQQ